MDHVGTTLRILIANNVAMVFSNGFSMGFPVHYLSNTWRLFELVLLKKLLSLQECFFFS